MLEVKVEKLYLFIDRCCCITARAKAGQRGWSISPLLFPPNLTARLCRLRLINHRAPALLLCFLFKCRIDGFSLHFIDLCIMVLSLLHHWEGAQRCRRACPGKGKAAWALCCLLFILEKLMCCEISILSDCRYSNGGN